MEEPITKEILRTTLASGQQSALDLLYNRYAGMLYGYILQFIPDREEAEDLLAKVFIHISPRLQQACDSRMSIYIWMQVEARQVILDHWQESGKDRERTPENAGSVSNVKNFDFYSLLKDATPEQKWVFRELFLNGRQKEELAMKVGKDLAYISVLLRESLLIIRKNIG